MNAQICEACGVFADRLDKHHIRSRGSVGRIDQPWNLLNLCRTCHTFFHTRGIENFKNKYPWLSARVKKAQEMNIKEVLNSNSGQENNKQEENK
jgi:hypothetical protein